MQVGCQAHQCNNHALSACAVLQVDPGTTYLIRQPTAHPIHENWRVELFRQLLSLPNLGLEQLKLLGEIMYQVRSCLALPVHRHCTCPYLYLKGPILGLQIVLCICPASISGPYDHRHASHSKDWRSYKLFCAQVL